MDLNKYIHVRIEKVNEATDPCPESDDHQACCFVRICCVNPAVVRKKNIQDLTTVEGLGNDLIHENILEDLKKECHCKGKIIGNAIHLEGDQKWRVENFLVQKGLASPELIKD